MKGGALDVFISSTILALCYAGLICRYITTIILLSNVLLILLSQKLHQNLTMPLLLDIALPH